MRQFNLKEYLKNPDVKLQTREGLPVQILCTNLAQADYPIAARVTCETGKDSVIRYKPNGKAWSEAYDLFFAPIKYVGYIAIRHNEGETYVSTTVFPSKNNAIKETGCDEVMEVVGEY